MKSEQRSDEIHPPAVKADFIPVGDFIIEDDFTHPIGWISLKRTTKRCVKWSKND